MEKLNGVVETHYGNGQLRTRANYKDGKLDGVVETYYGNGQLRTRANYKNGKREGVVETYYGNGQLKSRTNYKDGNLDGLVEEWYSNGQQCSRVTYKNGRRVGLRETWDENGQLEESATYKDGVKKLEIMEKKEKTKAESLAVALELKRDADYMLLGCACGIIECYKKYGVISEASLDQYNKLKETAKQRMKYFNGISDQFKREII